jgi:hypothetical protein
VLEEVLSVSEEATVPVFSSEEEEEDFVFFAVPVSDVSEGVFADSSERLSILEETDCASFAGSPACLDTEEQAEIKTRIGKTRTQNCNRDVFMMGPFFQDCRQPLQIALYFSRIQKKSRFRLFKG